MQVARLWFFVFFEISEKNQKKPIIHIFTCLVRLFPSYSKNQTYDGLRTKNVFKKYSKNRNVTCSALNMEKKVW